MEVDSVENTEISTFSSSNGDQQLENLIPHLLNNGDEEPKPDITLEVRNILEVIAANGKYWHDWGLLKNLLSFRLKQVLAEYPESKMAIEVEQQQNSLLVETYPELVKRLDEALLSFTDGPPFTLQRLCEILLTPQSMYPNLSKLALALEKNLLVTSTLTISTKPYPSSKPVGDGEGNIDPTTNLPKPIQNGIETSLGEANEDEEMTEAEIDENKNAKIDENKIAGEATEEQIRKTSEAAANSESEPITIPEPSTELKSTSP